MNGQPHAHKLEISDENGYWYVVYGDQRQSVYKPRPAFVSWPKRVLFGHKVAAVPSEREILQGAIQAIITRHDNASKRANQRAQLIAEITPRLNERQWGSDQLRGQ